MSETASTPLNAPLVDQITEQLQGLSPEELSTIHEFVAYLVWKRHRPETPVASGKSAEARAIARIQDLDDPTRWVTVVNEGDEIDIDGLHQRLKERGFQIEISDEGTRYSQIWCTRQNQAAF